MIRPIPESTATWVAEGLVGDGAERDDDDFGRKHEVGADRALDLVGLERARSTVSSASAAASCSACCAS
jgi:hypothetical protein